MSTAAAAAASVARLVPHVVDILVATWFALLAGGLAWVVFFAPGERIEECAPSTRAASAATPSPPPAPRRRPEDRFRQAAEPVKPLKAPHEFRRRPVYWAAAPPKTTGTAGSTVTNWPRRRLRLNLGVQQKTTVDTVDSGNSERQKLTPLPQPPAAPQPPLEGPVACNAGNTNVWDQESPPSNNLLLLDDTSARSAVGSWLMSVASFPRDALRELTYEQQRRFLVVNLGLGFRFWSEWVRHPDGGAWDLRKMDLATAREVEQLVHAAHAFVKGLCAEQTTGYEFLNLVLAEVEDLRDRMDSGIAQAELGRRQLGHFEHLAGMHHLGRCYARQFAWLAGLPQYGRWQLSRFAEEAEKHQTLLQLQQSPQQEPQQQQQQQQLQREEDLRQHQNVWQRRQQEFGEEEDLATQLAEEFGRQSLEGEEETGQSAPLPQVPLTPAPAAQTQSLAVMGTFVLPDMDLSARATRRTTTARRPAQVQEHCPPITRVTADNTEGYGAEQYALPPPPRFMQPPSGSIVAGTTAPGQQAQWTPPPASVPSGYVPSPCWPPSSGGK